MSPEEKQRRDEYRKTLTHEQRATMAIGVLMLNWAYWDGDITHHIFFLRDKAATEIDVSAQRVLSLHKDRLKTLRRLVVALTADKSEEVRRYDGDCRDCRAPDGASGRNSSRTGGGWKPVRHSRRSATHPVLPAS